MEAKYFSIQSQQIFNNDRRPIEFVNFATKNDFRKSLNYFNYMK